MIRNLKFALRETAGFVYLALKALRFWHRDPPVTGLKGLVRFVETRSKFVAQTTLYGYVKTRTGTRYTSLFEDDVFANSINIAKWEIYLACLCDLAVYAAAKVGRRTRAENAEICALAIHLVDAATRDEDIPTERPQGFDDVRAAFERRAHRIAWNEIPEGEGPFQNSVSALAEWAPVADEFKIEDADMIRNSMRFRWKRVRDQLTALIDADAVIEDWRSSGAQDSLETERLGRGG